MENIKHPYEYHDKDYYEYKLVGIVVHVGTADFGHYYSFINTNRTKEGIQNNEDNWLEFNDSKISKFSLEDLREECFGGSSDDSEGVNLNIPSIGIGRRGDNHKNAYLLFYERK